MDCTIFIRTRNEAALLSQSLQAIFTQKTELRYQVIVLDSESMDDTREILKKYPVQAYSIPPRFFSYSGALNLGVSLANTPYFICLSGDAVPAHETWLQSLVAPLIPDSRLACSFSKHLAWPEASQSTKNFLAKEFPHEDKKITPKIFEERISSEEPYSLARFSNTSACYRREVLATFPFRDIPFSEDRLAALFFLQAGYSVLYQPDSLIYHSHKPEFGAFRKVARLSTEARATINSLGYGKGSAPELASYSRLRLMQAAKLPFVLLLLSLKALSFSRSFSDALADLGTSIGKLEAYSRLSRLGVPESLPIASIGELRKNLTIL